MKGGSQASNAVTGLVNEPTYNALTKNFSNMMNSVKCATGGKPQKKRTTASKKKSCGCKKGGSTTSMVNTVSNSVTDAMSAVKGTLSSTFGSGKEAFNTGFNVYKSQPASMNASYSDLRGVANAKPATGGFAAGKNIATYMNNAESYSVQNRRGGSANTSADMVKPGLNYSGIATTAKMYGQVNSRTTPAAVERMLATNTASTTPALIKTTNYGSTTNSSSFFNYAGVDKLVAGGKKRKAVKAVDKKAVKKVGKNVKKLVKKPVK